VVIQRGLRFVLVSIKLVEAPLESVKDTLSLSPRQQLILHSARMQIEGRDANSHNTNSSGGATVTVGREREKQLSELLRQFVI
jgi:hypothetical protein